MMTSEARWKSWLSIQKGGKNDALNLSILSELFSMNCKVESVDYIMHALEFTNE